MQITFFIPEGKVGRVIDALVGIYKIPLDENDQPLFSPRQWARECVRQWIRNQVARWEQRQAIDAIPFSPEDDMVS